MESNTTYGFWQILRESIKLLSRNRRIISLCIIPLILLNSTIFLCNTFSSKVVDYDLLATSVFYSISPTGSEIANVIVIDEALFKIFRGVQFVFFLAHSFLSFYTIIMIIAITAASSHSSENNIIPIKNLIFGIAKACIRPLITWFHLTVFGIGYAVMALGILLGPLLTHNATGLRAFYIVLAIIAFLYYIHLSAIWVLAIIISVIEQNCYGIEALGKAGRIVQGKRLQGFILNCLLVVVSAILYVFFNLISANGGRVFGVISGLILINILVMGKILQFIAYTVIYIDRKRELGEEIELQGIIMEYDEIPAITLFRRPPLKAEIC